MFSEQEIQALALGAQWVSRQTDDEFALAARDALAKIGAVLPSELQHKLDDSAFHVGRRPKQPEAVDLRVVRQAMRDQHKLSIVYRDPQGAKTTRIIWPIGVGFFNSRRIIAGWCEMAERLPLIPGGSDRKDQAQDGTLSRSPSRSRQAMAGSSRTRNVAKLSADLTTGSDAMLTSYHLLVRFTIAGVRAA